MLFRGSSAKDQHLFISLSYGHCKAAGSRLAVDRVTTAQEPHHQSIDVSDSDYVPHAIQCVILDEQGARSVLRIEHQPSFNRDDFRKFLMKVSNNFLNLADSVNDKQANNVLNFISPEKKRFLEFLSRFENVNDIRQFSMRNISANCLQTEDKMISHISKYGLIGTLYLRDCLILNRK